MNTETPANGLLLRPPYRYSGLMTEQESNRDKWATDYKTDLKVENEEDMGKYKDNVQFNANKKQQKEELSKLFGKNFYNFMKRKEITGKLKNLRNGI